MAAITWNGGIMEVESGVLLSDALLARHPLEMPCAGRGTCGKCRVKAEGMLSPPAPQELRHLSGEELASGVRLACCCRVLGDCRVWLSAEGGGVIRLSGEELEFERAPMFARYGAAVDLGTTTIAARLYTREGLAAEAGDYNPQRAYGADVISRVGASLSGKGGELADCVRRKISGLLEEMAGRAGIQAAEIGAVVITGNTAMLYLLTGRPPQSLAAAPFEADCLFGETLTGAELGLACGAAEVYLPSCMSAFVGADIACAVLASGMTRRRESALLADIGTNGEMVLWHEGKATCCSTAAGPAFEGAGLSMGMSGKPGAVDHVKVAQGKLQAHVIGGGEPVGICGSGVIDATACLLETGVLEETGYLEEAAQIAGTVSVTGEDIRMIQLAKSAVCSGIEALLHHAGLSRGEAPELLIAGGFGSYLDVGSAAAIGLIPAALARKTRAIGNAALSGASMLLQSRPLAAELGGIARKSGTLDLSTDSYFLEAYVENMLFPE